MSLINILLKENNMKVWNILCKYKNGEIVSRPVWLDQSFVSEMVCIDANNTPWHSVFWNSNHLVSLLFYGLPFCGGLYRAAQLCVLWSVELGWACSYDLVSSQIEGALWFKMIQVGWLILCGLPSCSQPGQVCSVGSSSRVLAGRA